MSDLRLSIVAGFITTGDLRAAIGDTFEDADVEDILSAADADGDGRIGTVTHTVGHTTYVCLGSTHHVFVT